MRKDRRGWGEIARVMHDSRENVRAAYRRLVGAKQGSYLDKEELKPRNKPVVAVLDIETLPGLGYFWKIFDENISIDMIEESPCMLSWAGKYLNETHIQSDIMTPDEIVEGHRNTLRIARSIWEFLSQANAVTGHNFSGFDMKFINTEFLKHGLPPLKLIIIDTLSIYRKNFYSPSYKMKFINRELGIKEKTDNEGFPLWKKCAHGEPAALKTMLEYNEGDVRSSEDLYYRIRPYIRNFNVALYNEITAPQCPVCGSEHLTSEGWYFTPAGKWESLRCECGCLSRTKYNELDKAKKKALLVNS